LAISISLPADRVTARVAFRAAIVAAVIVAIGATCVVVARSQLFAVRTVEVSGASRLSDGRIVSRAHIGEDANTLWFDEAEAERRLERHTWIADAQVSVELPSTVLVSVVERIPVAVASGRLGDLYLAADGTALGRANSPAGLPTVDGADSLGARRAAAAILTAMPPALRAEVAEMTVRADASLEVVLREGQSVEFGSVDRAAAKVLSLRRILEWADASGERVARVNLVAPGEPAVELA
jgi:cell division protein FtsQ